MENAIANHEFEKARFYSDEERKERENMRQLREKYNLDDSSTGCVTKDDIEEVVRKLKPFRISNAEFRNKLKNPQPALGMFDGTFCQINPIQISTGFSKTLMVSAQSNPNFKNPFPSRTRKVSERNDIGLQFITLP